MVYCPNCGKPLQSAETLDCPFCTANFGEGASWKPVEVLPVHRLSAGRVVFLFALLGPVAGSVVSGLLMWVLSVSSTLYRMAATLSLSHDFLPIYAIAVHVALALVFAHFFGGVAAIFVGWVYVSLRETAISRWALVTTLAGAGAAAQALFIQTTGFKKTQLLFIGTAALTGAIFALWVSRPSAKR